MLASYQLLIAGLCQLPKEGCAACCLLQLASYQLWQGSQCVQPSREDWLWFRCLAAAGVATGCGWLPVLAANGKAAPIPLYCTEVNLGARGRWMLSAASAQWAIRRAARTVWPSASSGDEPWLGLGQLLDERRGSRCSVDWQQCCCAVGG